MPEDLLERVDTEFPGAIGSVTLASPSDLASQATGRDRRAFMRHGQSDLLWVRIARLQFGQGVSLVDLSSGGARIDSPVALGPNSVQTLEIVGGGLKTVVPFRVLRCEVEGLTPNGLIYRGACEFMRPLELPARARSVPEPAPPEDVLDLDVALQKLIARVGVPGDPDRLSPAQALQALKALQARTMSLLSDPLGERLTALLRFIVPALEQGRGLITVMHGIETHLRGVVPYARVRLAGAPGVGTDPDVHSILIGIPGVTAGPLVSIDVPRTVRLDAWQLRVLRTTSRLIVLLQRLEPTSATNVAIFERPQPSVPSPSVQTSAASTAARTTEPTPSRVQPAVAPIAVETPEKRTADVPASLDAGAPQMAEAAGWQKVVVRYTEGQSLKGYTQDFLASRAHFTLRSCASVTEGEAVIVPLLRLKALFFVREFAGNPGYIERTDLPEPQGGRPIEVTLSDEEVIVGTTNNYRSDGQGFFVTPVDPLANNIRIFIVANSVRQIRFPAPRQRAAG
jgi:hypothetical protein